MRKTISKQAVFAVAALALGAIASATPSLAIQCKSTPVVGHARTGHAKLADAKDDAIVQWVLAVQHKYGGIWNNYANSKQRKFINCRPARCSFSAIPCRSHS